MSETDKAPPSSPFIPADLDEKWVVMIYMAATSPRLCDAMERDLRELNQRLSNLGLNDLFVVVQADTPDGQYVTRQRLLGGGRVKALPPAIAPSNLTGMTTKQYFIREFIRWRFHDPGWYWPGKDRKDEPKPVEEASTFGCPVSAFGRTLLVLWGHSQGIAAALSQPGSPAFAMVGAGGFGFDPLYGDALTLPQIRCAIIDGLECKCDCGPHRINILSFDSCFMSAAEAAVELQEQPANQPAGQCGQQQLQVDFLLAAQTAILLDGLDYSRLADVFVPNKCVEPIDLGLRILSQAAYGDDSPTSLSLLRLTTRPSVQQAPAASSSQLFEDKFSTLVSVLRTVLNIPTTPSGGMKPVPNPTPANRAEWLRIRDAFEATTWHRVRQFIDVADLCRRLLNNSREATLRAAAWYVLQELRTEAPGVPGQWQFLVDVRTAHPYILSGVSVYCPWLHPTPTEVRDGAWSAVVSLEDYQELRFSKTTGWGKFLDDAKALMEESRQRSINAELEDIRRAIDLAADGRTDPPARRDFERFRIEQPKPPDDRFQLAEPQKPKRYREERPPNRFGGGKQSEAFDRSSVQSLLKAPALESTE